MRDNEKDCNLDAEISDVLESLKRLRKVISEDKQHASLGCEIKRLLMRRKCDLTDTRGHEVYIEKWKKEEAERAPFLKKIHERGGKRGGGRERQTERADTERERERKQKQRAETERETETETDETPGDSWNEE